MYTAPEQCSEISTWCADWALSTQVSAINTNQSEIGKYLDTFGLRHK